METLAMRINDSKSRRTMILAFLAFSLQTVSGMADTWQIECADCPPDVVGMSDRRLRLDNDGNPNVAYGGDHLYFTWFDGDLWRREIVDADYRVGQSASLDLTASGQPHISYEDANLGTLKYAYRFSGQLGLVGAVTGSDIQLIWTTCLGASAYWIYGAENKTFFMPGDSPGYMFRLVVLPADVQTWSSPGGVGDPENNWTYLVVAVDETEAELARSNRVGEQDFDTDIP